MRYLLEKVLLQGLDKKIQKSPRVFLFLDYDGTLTPIQNSPDLALFSSSTRMILRDLSSLPQIIMTIISGRTLKQIRKLVGLRNIDYVGNHGLETRVKSIVNTIPQESKIREKLTSLSQEIRRRTRRFPGVLVENKGLTLSIHYRLAEEDCLPEIKRIVGACVYPFRKSYEIREGKKVLELKPKTRRNKGWAVEKIIQLYAKEKKAGNLYFYLGDDSTDEDAFKLTNSRRGYSILVDNRSENSSAQYYLENPKEVRFFLGWLRKILTCKERRKP